MTPDNPAGSDLPRFLCDVMLARLGRWLRAAGYDTEMADARRNDRDLLRLAESEKRILLTCDRKVAEHRAAERRAIVLPSNDLDRAVEVLSAAVPTNWLRAPFTRCLIDNAILREAAPEEHDRLPLRSRDMGKDGIFICPECNRIYWPGSHVRRMKRRLAQWQAYRPTPGGC